MVRSDTEVVDLLLADGAISRDQYAGAINHHKSNGGNSGGSTEADSAQQGSPTFVMETDASPCPVCGSLMVRRGSCAMCYNCGTSNGCAG